MNKLVTSSAFDSAHFLAGYNGKCANIHGHRWVIRVTVCGDELETCLDRAFLADLDGKDGRVVLGDKELVAGLCLHFLAQTMLCISILVKDFLNGVNCPEVARTGVHELQQ